MLFNAACDSGHYGSADDDSDGTATFVIGAQDRYGLSVVTRAGEEEDAGSDEGDGAGDVLPEGLSDLKYVLSDGEGNIIGHHQAVMSDDFSRLTLEGLKSGRYSIMFVGGAAGNGSMDLESPVTVSDPWLVNKNSGRPVNSVYYYKKVDFAIGFDQAPVNESVELDLAVAKVDVAVRMDNPALWRHIKKVTVTLDGEVSTALNADGSYSGGHKVAEFDITDPSGVLTFVSFPSAEPVDGHIDVVSTVDGGEEFSTRYTFEGLNLRKGTASRIELVYRHPESKAGLLYVADDQLWRFEPDTMFMSDEPREVFYNNSIRSFYVNAPLRFLISDDHKLGVRLFSPIGVGNVRVLGRFRDISSEWVDLAYFERIPPFMECFFDLPVVSKECLYKTESGRYVRIPAQPDLSSNDIEIRFETDDPFMAKISTIDSRWYIRFSPFGADNGHASWRHMTPILCRHGVALALNMAFMFASPEFNAELNNYDGILKDNGGSPINLNNLRKSIRNHGGLQLGRVVGVGGLGGGQTYGLADYCYTGVYHDATAPNSNPHNYARQAMFHEYGHCLGYNHSSNMTYGDVWTVLCAKMFVQLGREGKLPVPNRTDVTSLPYQR